ncbi:hypothetical protein L6E12_25070 [Actinokineospora sp. PR83]|uniref:hypothetical protein n=1 Tax=Actinokineospora sp. PR83 TaxID=2884908 RepID=UPI001F3348F9|nr:hypothetical protein [Actinokineospora sp. PR83]MCG8919055.1 hypothetical protein [Actinokineospora sp. PR83]
MVTTSAPLPLNPTSPNLAVEPSRTPTRRPPLPRPAPARPGRRLRAAIDTALSGLGTDSAETTAQTLVTGLAWTAACGETCQVAPQVAAVRAAITALAAGDVDAAGVLLTEAARVLHDLPPLPAPRHAAADDLR